MDNESHGRVGVQSSSSSTPGYITTSYGLQSEAVEVNELKDHDEKDHTHSMSSAEEGYDWSNIVKKIKKPCDEWVLEDFSGVEFESVEAADKFYRTYGQVLGFDVRKAEMKTSKTQGVVFRRRWVCSKGGFNIPTVSIDERKRKPRKLSRCGCLASFRVNYSFKRKKYFVKEFQTIHNHYLNPELIVLQSQCGVRKIDKKQKKLGFKGQQMLEYMVHQSGDSRYLSSSMEELNELLDSDGRENILDIDSEKAIAYLTKSANADPDFYCRYVIDRDNRLRCLFWADGTMRADFAYFGDVVRFDFLCDGNGEKLPYVLILGVDNHNLAMILGCACVSDETEDCYTWLLKSFLDCMRGMFPTSVITNDDKSMILAINSVFPRVKHRLCFQHLKSNCAANVSAERFHDLFLELMLHVEDQDEFELKWKQSVELYELENHNWVQYIYGRRHMWALAYLKDSFFGGMTTNKQIEGVDFNQKRNLGSGFKLYEFARQINIILDRLREMEIQNDCISKYTAPKITTHLYPIESHAGTVYTRNIFHDIKKEIISEASYSVRHCELYNGRRTYQVVKFGDPHLTYTVHLYVYEQRPECSCQLLKYKGIPCRHIFCVMKNENFLKIPDNLILKRWTKDAKKLPSFTGRACEQPVEVVHAARRAELSYMSRELVYLASRCEGSAYDDIMGDLNRLTNRLEELNANTQHDQARADEQEEMNYGTL